MNAKDKGRRYAEIDILENPGITRPDLDARRHNYVNTLYISPKARAEFLIGWLDAVEAHFNAPEPEDAPLYRIVDNYTGATEYESDSLSALEKELQVMQEESGRAIWHIEPDPEAVTLPAPTPDDYSHYYGVEAPRNPEILDTLSSLPDPAKTAPDLYIASITVKCAICGDETIIDLSEKYDAAEVAEALKKAVAAATVGDQCLTCYADMQRAQALNELDGLDPID